MPKKSERHMCPVCGKYEFEYHGSFDICPFCGWEDDNLQEAYPDLMGGANTMSLNQMREGYKMGKTFKEIEKEAEEIFRARKSKECSEE